MTRELAPSKNELERYIAKGLTQRQIRDAWEADSGTRVARTTIAMALARHGLKTIHRARCSNRWGQPCSCRRTLQQ